jgi:hypothetical protein
MMMPREGRRRRRRRRRLSAKEEDDGGGDAGLVESTQSRITKVVDKHGSWNNDVVRPYFYYRNVNIASVSDRSSSRPHYFSLDSSSHRIDDHRRHHDTTTLSIIIFLHVVYLFQWNARRTRRDVCARHDQLVIMKQFYRAPLAIVSHPPAEKDASNDIGGRDAVAAATGAGDDHRRFSSLRGGIIPICGRVIPMELLRTMRTGGRSLSGLPLLAYSSHLLWQCRALEELYDIHDGRLVLGVIGNNVTSLATELAGIIGTTAQIINDADHIPGGTTVDNDSRHPLLSLDGGYSYLRVLLALNLTSMLLELGLSRCILRKIYGIVDFDGYSTTPRQLLAQRAAMCSIASLSTAVLGVYGSHFPYAPPPVLPFGLNFLSSSRFSHYLSILILMAISRGIHPITSIVSGLWSGWLWSWGLTTFLGTRYWGNCTLFISVLAMLLSLKAQPSYSTYLKIYVPCIDYVAWNELGEIPNGREETPLRDEDEIDLENGSNSIEDTLPPYSSHSVIRGRVPRMDSSHSDLVEAEDLVEYNEETVPAAPLRFGALLSRRPGGSRM